eukprot:4417282-Pleurochrysis_carterae.AAC.1
MLSDDCGLCDGFLTFGKQDLATKHQSRKLRGLALAPPAVALSEDRGSVLVLRLCAPRVQE